jgi:hypothetical protein
MAKTYFRQVPNFDYVSRVPGEQNISDYITVKNLFKRGKLRSDIFGNLNFFTKYKIIGDERPDNVAFKLYGDSTLDWIILLSNNIVNVQNEWPLTQRTFNEVMLEKYGSYDNLYNGIRSYQTSEVRDSQGRIVLRGGLGISPTWKTNGNFVEIVNSQIAVISSGDSLNPSTTVTVFLVNGIPELQVGDQVNINNVTENQYNGAQIVTEILATDGFTVTGFRYELPFVPNIASPVLADPRDEEALFVVPETSTVTANSYYYEFWDPGLGYTVYVPSSSFVVPVTNYEYENNLQDERRNIFALKPDYLNVIFNDLDDILPYKRGGDQFVNTTLKRGDNIRLFG